MHFASKAELHNTLLERETGEMFASIGSALEGAPADARERLRTGVDAFFAFVEEHPFAWRMIFRDPPTDPEVARAYGEQGGRAVAATRAFVEATELGPALESPHAAEIFTQLLISSQTGLAFWWYGHREVPREVLVERVIDFCWTGMERLAAGAS
jgi:AcrR family transcriptional regulator